MKNHTQKTKPQAVQSLEPQESSITFGSRELSEEELISIVGGGVIWSFEKHGVNASVLMESKKV